MPTWSKVHEYHQWNPPPPPHPNRYVFSKEHYDIIEEMSLFHCTDLEIASALGISQSTLSQLKRTNEEVLKRITLGQAKGKRALRSVQFRVALQGNVNMLIFLGKVLLGQDPDNNISLNIHSHHPNPNNPDDLPELSKAAKLHLAELSQSIYHNAKTKQVKDIEAEVQVVTAEPTVEEAAAQSQSETETVLTPVSDPEPELEPDPEDEL